MDAIDQYQNLVSAIMGMYSDAIWGFSKVLEEARIAHSNKIPGTNSFLSYTPRNAPQDIPHRLTHEEMMRRQRTQSSNIATTDKIINRNQIDGHNSVLIAQSTIITLFHYWDDHYRALIASDLGLTRTNDLRVDAMGELRQLRISIVHHKGIAIKQVARNKRFSWFAEGDYIKLTFDHVLAIKAYLVTELRGDCEALRSS